MYVHLNPAVVPQDLIITGIFTFLWLVASSAWGKGLTDVKWSTSTSEFLSLISVCKILSNKCTSGAIPLFGPLNSSVVSLLDDCSMS